MQRLVRKPGHQIKTQRREAAENHGGRQQTDEVAVDGTGVFGGKPVVDDLAQRHRQRQGRRGRDQQRAERGQHFAPVGTEERNQRPQGAQGLEYIRGRIPQDRQDLQPLIRQPHF